MSGLSLSIKDLEYESFIHVIAKKRLWKEYEVLKMAA